MTAHPFDKCVMNLRGGMLASNVQSLAVAR